MRGSYKQFDQSLFNEFDSIARQRVISYLTEYNALIAVENDDKYGPDIVLYSDYSPYCYVEVEVKRNWKAGQESFPFDTIQLPERKAKFLQLGLPIDFFVLREDAEFAVVIPGELLNSDLLVEVSNKYSKSGELFYQVPIDECQIVDLGIRSPE